MMARNLKVLGLGLVAVLALSAVSASGAMALTPKVQVGTGDGHLDGTQIGNIVTTVGGGRTITCETVKFSTSLAEATANVPNITALYEKCHSTLAGVKVPATLTMNGCTFTIHVGATTGGTDQYAATTDIACPAEKVIEVHVYKEGTNANEHLPENQLCGYTIGGQSGVGSSTITNITTSDMEMNMNFSGIAYKRTLGTIPNCGAAASTETRTGKVTWTGTTTAGGATTVQIVEL